MSKKIHPKGELKAHPAANVFPMMEAKDLAPIIEDMKTRGFLKDNPIVMLNGEVLDGRNRYYASIEAGVTPVFRDYDEKKDGPVSDFVTSHNLNRRHLTASQRAAAAAALIPFMEAEAKERQKAGQFKPGEGGKGKAGKGGKAGKEGKAPEAPAAGTGAPEGDKGAKGGKDEGESGRTADIVAQRFGVSATMVKKANKLRKSNPEVYDKVLAGKITATKAIADMEAADAEEKAKKQKELERAEREQALRVLFDRFGEESEIYAAAKGRKILKVHKDLLVFAGLTQKKQEDYAPLLAIGWGIPEIEKYREAKLDGDSKIDDLINAAIAHNEHNKADKVERTIKVPGWIITVVEA